MNAKHFLKTACLWLLIAVGLIAAAIVLRAGFAQYKSIGQYITADVAYTDGSVAHFDDADFGTVNRDDVVTLHILLPQEPHFDDAVLAFSAENAMTEVRCGGTCLYSYGKESAEQGRMIGHHDFLIAVPDTAWGNEITMVLLATENRAFSGLTDIKLYPAEAANRFYTDRNPFGLPVALSLFVIGIVGLLCIVLGRVRNRMLQNGILLVLTEWLAALWMLAGMGFYPVFGFYSYLWQPLAYIAGYALPIPLLLFYGGMAEKHSEWTKRFRIFAVLAGCFFVASLALHFTNILHFNALAIPAGILWFLCFLLIAVYSISLKCEKNSPDAFLKNGMYLCSAALCYELLLRPLLCLTPFSFLQHLPSLIAIGILVWIGCMATAFCCALFEQRREGLTEQFRTDTIKKIIGATPTGICQMIPDERHTIVTANDIFYQMMGYRDADLNGQKPQSALTFLRDGEQDFLRNKVKQILQSGEDHGEFEFSLTDANQKAKTILARYFYDRDGNGNITVSIFDISERKRIVDELRIHSEEYRLAVEASDHYYFNYDAATKTCTHMFDSEELFGISEKVEGIPESLVELGICAPESVDEYRRAFRMFADGVPKGDFIFHLQNVKTHIFRWYGGSYRTIFDADGVPLRAVVAFRDITEQREKEIAYNIHKQQIESHPEEEINYFELNLTTGTCSYSYGLEAKEVSALASSRWDEMVDCAVKRYVHPEDRTTLTDFLKTKRLLSFFERGVTEAVQEYRGYLPDGTMRWLQASVRITADEKTHEIMAYCAMENIDAEKAKELERQSEQKRSRYYEDAYDKLASSVMYGVCKYSADEDLTIIFANDIFYQMHGYHSQEEAIAAGFTSILFATPPFGKELVRASHNEYTAGKAGQLFETEYPTIDANGNRIWILCRGIYSPEEGIFNSSVLNITDRKNTEERLRVSEQRYRLALDQSGKVFFFFDVPTRTMHLSDELAQAFGLPNEVDNMPDNFISQGLVEPQSIEKYRAFYEEIYAGKPTGSTVISCHMRSAPEQVLWYKIAFTSVFNAAGVPQSAIITYEDLQEERANKIAGAWKQFNLLSTPESKYVIAEYNLTQNALLSQIGGLFAAMPDFVKTYDEINQFVLDHFIYEEDIPAYKQFLDRDRLLALFAEGKMEDSIEYRSLQAGSYPRWTSTSIQMIQDPYSNDIMAQLLFMDIHAEKSGQIEMTQSIEELRKELENSRIKVMINQMQPHFLYNALSAIQTIVKIDPDYASRLIYDFTVHLRSSIKALSSDAPIPFNDELKNIKAYLNIEQMRFGDSLKVNYEIDCDRFSVIPLSIQPLAENAARHGVYPKGDAGGTVTVRTYEMVNAYVVEVEDDGVGFNSKEILEKDGDSVGLKSLIFRLKSLMDADVVINSRPGIGTKVTVTIPKKGA